MSDVAGPLRRWLFTSQARLSTYSLRRNAFRSVTRARSAIKLAGTEPHLRQESGAPHLARLNEYIDVIDDHSLELFETRS
ncbi:MAG TPA: hypothetical protein VMU68_00615 [Acidimicrobiales bacterium]|nr:hypothetical protein [Acidimicrobiales bacterium]